MTAKLRNHLSVKSSAFNHAPTQPADWVIHEFARVQLPDERLRHRLHMIATAFAQKPTAPIPQACANPAEAKAAYRFVENERIDAGAVRRAHEQTTVERARNYPVVLAIQDTTTLNYTTHPKTQGLGPIGTHAKNIGLLLHSTLAVTPKGQPLGFVHSCVRKRRGRGQAAKRHRKPLVQKESYKWIESLQACQRWAAECPQTQWVNISDREGDIYELLAQAQSGPAEGRVAVLVRSRHDRRLEDQDRTLWQEVARQPVAATLAVRVGRKGEQPSRMARLNVCFCGVQLRPPSRQAGAAPIQVWAIEAREVGPVPKGATRIVWRLVSTLAVTSAQEAIEKVAWYAQRWQIEVIHKVLKSGCQIEQRQLETAARLERALAIDMVVAWRVLALCKAARELPDAPVSEWLEQAQWQALCCYVHQQTTPPPTAPSVRQAVRWIAQLGGFLARKSDGEPGTKTLWRGLQELMAMTRMWQLFHDEKGGPKCG